MPTNIGNQVATYIIPSTDTYFLSAFSNILATGDGINAGSITGVELIIAGSVIASQDGFDSVISSAGRIGISVASTGLVQAGDDGMILRTSGGTLVNDGSIVGLAGSGLDTYANGTDGPLNIFNNGTIYGASEGISVASVTGATVATHIVNTGSISGGSGIFLSLLAADDARIVNSGTIFGDDSDGAGVRIRSEGVVVNNSGTIGGVGDAISGSDNRDVIYNSGTMQGAVVLNSGDDVYRASGDGLATGGVRGGGGNDDIRGARDADALDGGNGNDRLRGREGEDTLVGGNGRDIIFGGDGDDLIEGGNAGDLMLGGSGSDEFLFTDTGDIGTTGATRDEIRDFEQGIDIINLAAMVGPDFIFLGTGGFTGGAAPELRLAEAGGSTFVQLDYDGDGSQDGRMLVRGVVDMTVDDFIL